jgi:nucleotide-binding universal stress UspA family protein
VIETVSSAEYEEFASFYEELEARTARHLGELALRLEAPDLEVVRSVLNGKPAEEILRFAVDEEVDLIVLASHRLDPSKPGYGWSTLSYTGLGSRTMSGAAGQMRTGSGETHA